MENKDEERHIRWRLDRLDTQYDKTDKKLDKVLFYLFNDDNTTEPGLIDDVRQIKKTMGDFINEQKTKEAVSAAKSAQRASIYGSVTGLLGGILTLIFKGLVERYAK